MNRPSILLIEDDGDGRANLCDTLELNGYRVEAASTGERALGRHQLDQFFAILLDRHLPDTTAEELLPKIKAAAPETEVVIITGYVDLEGSIAALRHGAADYLSKPIDAEVLLATLTRLKRLQDAERRAREAERLATIGQTAAVLAHEGRNVMHGMRLHTALLKLELQDRADIVEILERLERTQRNLGRLFDDFTFYASSLALEPESLDLRAVWRNAWNELERSRTGKDAQLMEEDNGLEPYVWGDRFRLEQVFRNLFQNALAASPAPARVTIHWASTINQGHPMLRLSVTDNGPGLSPQQRQRAFEPFFTTKLDGTGLGLSIVKRIIEAHGGEVHASENHAGAQFVLSLPREAKCEVAPTGENWFLPALQTASSSSTSDIRCGEMQG